MTNKQPDFDIIVIGAGLVGSSFVLSLQDQGLRIALVEKHLPDARSSDDRPISLSYGSVAIFRTLGLWAELQAMATPILQVEVSEQGVLGAVHFNASEHQVDALGQVISFSALSLALYQRVKKQSGVVIFPIDAITAISRADDVMRVSVNTDTGESVITAALLVGCDGSLSSVRQLLNMPVIEKHSDHVAMTATLKLKKPHQSIALERFTAQGVMAVLPLPEKTRCGLVITMPHKVWDERMHWSPSEWMKTLDAVFSERLGEIVDFTPGGVFPLKTLVAQEPVLPQVVLLGNAAHTLYPLAAQGFNLGLRDAAALAEIIVAERQSLGELHVLQRYIDWRHGDQQQVMRLTNTIARFFSFKFPAVAKARGLGLLALDVVTPLKRRFAALAMGIVGRLPKLMRGVSLTGQYHE